MTNKLKKRLILALTGTSLVALSAALPVSVNVIEQGLDITISQAFAKGGEGGSGGSEGEGGATFSLLNENRPNW